MSRMRLFAAEVQGVDTEPVAIDNPLSPSVMAVRAFAGGPAGQAEVLKVQGIHLSVPGDSWLIGEPREDDDNLLTANWFVVTREEIDRRGNIFRVMDEGGKWRDLHPDSIITKVMRAHPRRRWEAWSPNRAALPILSEIKLLSQHIYASAQSRLAGAGLLVVPNEWSFPGTPQTGNQPGSFVQTLGETMLTALGNPESPAAVVPIVIQVPGEHADKVQHITFDTPFDERIIQLRDSAIRRYAATIDLPAEVLLGIADLQHWNAWAVSEQALTMHIEPLMALLCHAYTENYLHPVLDAMGEDTTNQVIWYDPTELSVDQDKSANTLALYDRILASGTAARREAGLSESDAPTDEEKLEQVVLSTVKSAPTLAPVLLPLIGISLDIPPATEQALVDAAPGPALPAGEAASAIPASDGKPDTAPNKPAMAANQAGLVAACDGVMHRAIERAGSRLRSVGGEPVRATVNGCALVDTHTKVLVASSQVDDLLREAWGRVPEIAARYQVDSGRLTNALNDLASLMLVAGMPYDLDRLTEALAWASES
jgi:hypothetical protein